MKLLPKISRLPRLIDELRVLVISLRDPRAGWRPRIVGLLLLAYVLSPVDLILDVVPFLGLLDDLVLIPLAAGLIRRLLQPEVLSDARQRVEAKPTRDRVARAGIAIIIAAFVALWVIAVIVMIIVMGDGEPKENTGLGPVPSKSGAKEIRTPDLIIANDALYQLSYRPIGSKS